MFDLIEKIVKLIKIDPYCSNTIMTIENNGIEFEIVVHGGGSFRKYASLYIKEKDFRTSCFSHNQNPIFFEKLVNSGIDLDLIKLMLEEELLINV